MDVERIRELRLADPFRPFYLVLKDGRKLPVDKPYYLGISPTKRFIVHSSVGGGDETVTLDRIADVDFEDVKRETVGPPHAVRSGS